MTLGEVIDYLTARDPEKVVEHGFGRPRSYRGYYECVAFEPVEQTTVGAMLAHAKAALGNTYEGYKGGMFTMYADTDTYLAEWGRTGDEISRTLLDRMMGDPATLTVEYVRAAIEREDDASTLALELAAELERVRSLAISALEGAKWEHSEVCKIYNDMGGCSCDAGAWNAPIDAAITQLRR